MAERESSAAIQRLGLPLSNYIMVIIPYLRAELRTSLPVTIKIVPNKTNIYASRDMVAQGVSVNQESFEIVGDYGYGNISGIASLNLNQQKFMEEAVFVGARLSAAYSKIKWLPKIENLHNKIESEYKQELVHTFFSKVSFIMIDNFDTLMNLTSLITYNARSGKEAFHMLRLVIKDTIPMHPSITYMEMFSDMPNAFWGELARAGVFPTMFTSDNSEIDPKFLVALKNMRIKYKKKYSGGCPARRKTYYNNEGLSLSLEKSAVTLLSEFFLEELEKRINF